MDSTNRSTVPNSELWRDRCDFWAAKSSQKSPRRRREREASPLVLTGHGLSLRVDRGCLLVRDGNTHYPATQREWRFFKGGLDIPPAILIVDGSGYVSLDAIEWLTTQQVLLIRLRWDGQFSCVINAGAQAASSDRIRWQERTRDDPKARLAFALGLIQRKVSNTLVTMESYVPRSPIWGKAFTNIESRKDAMHSTGRPRSLHALLGIEGAIGAEYFRAWSGIELKWSAAKRSVIPDDWRAYVSRSALREKARNRRATHPVNAMLNYAYGILSARTHIRLIAEGYDPTIGVLHNDVEKAEGEYYGFVLDHIEPMRPVVDRAILELVNSVTFCRADFSIQHDGTCRLNPELARRVTQVAAHYCDSVSATEGWQSGRMRWP